MEFSTWLIFSCISFIAVISPGPAVLLSVTNSLTLGFNRSVYSSLGNITGLFIVSGVAICGLGAALQTSAVLFISLKVSGAIYLIYLGVLQWNAKSTAFEKPIDPEKESLTKSNPFVQGVFVAISNPKAILFFTALFPQFIDLSKPVLIQFLILTTTFMLYSFMMLVVYAIGAQSVKAWFSKGNRTVWFNRVSGTLFISFGLGILNLGKK